MSEKQSEETVYIAAAVAKLIQPGKVLQLITGLL